MELSLPFLAFLDLETTGLDPAADIILEIGIVLTDRNLETLAVFDRVVCWPELRYNPALQEMEIPFGVHDKVVEMHTKNGLWEESYRSTKDLEACLADAAYWLGQHMGDLDYKVYMAGNTIGFDRQFLYMNDFKFLDIFHHRSVDVSSLRVLYEEWVTKEYDYATNAIPVDNDLHRAIPDCHDSINKLKFFRKSLFGINRDIHA